MKRVLIFCLCYVIFPSINAQNIFNITNVGTSFNPQVLNVNKDDLVHFNLSAAHPVFQVSESTWNINGNTALPGGFSFPSGTGDYTANTAGTFYFICNAHIDLGMKGKIVVTGPSGLSTTEVGNEIKIFPNPANDFITLQNTRNLIMQEIRIIDISGRTVKNIQEPNSLKENVSLDIKNLNKGIYFVSVISTEKKYTEKFMKQ